MYLDTRKAREMYLNDPEFHALVTYIRQSMEKLQFTPSEMRAAVTFAAVQAEMEKPVDALISQVEWEKIRGDMR